MLSLRTEGHSLPYLQCGQFKGVHITRTARHQNNLSTFIHKSRHHTSTTSTLLWCVCEKGRLDQNAHRLFQINEQIISISCFFSRFNENLKFLFDSTVSIFCHVCLKSCFIIFFCLLFSVTIDLYLAISVINNRWERDQNRANCHLCAGAKFRTGNNVANKYSPLCQRADSECAADRRDLMRSQRSAGNLPGVKGEAMG